MYESYQGVVQAPNQNYSAYYQKPLASAAAVDMQHRRRSSDPGYTGAAAIPVKGSVKPAWRNLRPVVVLGIAIVLVDIIAFFIF